MDSSYGDAVAICLGNRDAWRHRSAGGTTQSPFVPETEMDGDCDSEGTVHVAICLGKPDGLQAAA